MNKTYRLIWNEITHTWVAVAECVKAHGKRKSIQCTASMASEYSGRLALKKVALALAAAGLGSLGFTAHGAEPAATQLPTGGTVVAGQASISQSGAVMNINQSSQRAAIDWATFNVGAAATVNFNQPSVNSVTLNRVLDSNASQIYGRINALGQVFFSNPNGMYFAPSASVDVGGLIVTTHSISNADFMAGNYRFTRNGATGSIINEGNINAGLGGYVALLAPEVRNNGVIVAQIGTVALAAGEAFELQFDGSNALSNIRVEPSTIKAYVENGNAIYAPGGLIILSANAASQLQGSVVKNNGTLNATSMVSKGGRVLLEGDEITLGSTSRIEANGVSGGGTVLVGGDWQGSGDMRQATQVTMAQGATINANAIQEGDGGKVVLWSNIKNANSQTRVYGQVSATGGANSGNGGNIETSGHWLDVAGFKTNTSAAKGNYGNWLLDPYNITIAASGASGTAFSSNYTANATSIILASDIANALASGNVTVQTGGTDGDGQGGGDITIASNITKTSGGAATLTLKAHRDIIQNSNIAVSSSSGALNVIYNSDSDATNGGHIELNNGASISSNGGNITLSGGLDVNTGYATGSGNTVNFDRGVFLNNASLNAAGGNILVRGKGWSGTGSATPIGVDFSFGSSMTTTGAGTVTIVGVGGTPTSGTASGINLFTGSGTAATVTTQNGAISLTGTGGGNTTQNRNAGINYETSPTYIYSTGGGAITLTGTGDNRTVNSRGIAQANGGTLYLGWDGTTTYGSNITLSANSMYLEGANIKTTGTVTLNSTGIASQTTSGSIIGGALALTGTGGAFTLTRTTNNVATLAANTGSLSYVDADALSIGTVGSTTGITATGDINVTASTGSLSVDQNIAKTVGSDASLNLKAQGNIVLAAGKSISSSNNKLNVTLNSDTDANSDGAILLNSASSITSNGGNVTLGGGADPSTGLAFGNATYNDGIKLNNASIDAGSGAISLRGKGSSTGGNGVYLTGSGAIVSTSSGAIDINGTAAGTGGGRIGVFVDQSAAIRTTGGGNITITGQGSLAGTANNNEGVKLDNGGLVEIQSGTNRTLTINGTGGTGNSYNIGVNVRGNSSVMRMGSGVTGQMNVTGTGGTCSGTGCWGVLVEGNGVYESLGAASITLNGTGGSGADNKGIRYTGGTSSRIGSSSMTGDITLIADTVDLTGSDGTMRVLSSGALTIKPKTASTTIGIAGGTGTLALTAGNFASTFSDGFSSITVGNANAGAITVGGTITLNDATTFVSNGGITLNGALNGSGQTITLTGGNGQTVSGNGNIIASSLLLNGNGATYTLNTATGNNVGTLAASTGSGNINFTNSAAMTIGSVGGVNGLNNTGTINVETLAGNLTVTQNITTTDTSANAVRLIAGKNTAAGTSTGGDIVVSGSPTISVGTGGFANLYTGSVAGSSGVTALVGSGSGRFRYNSNASTTNFATALTAGVNAVFREQPTVTIKANDVSKTYDAAIYTGGFTYAYNNLANGDSTLVITGTVTLGGPALTATAVGNHAITATGTLSNALGYAVAFADGALTITKPLEPPAPPPVPPVAPSPKPETSPAPLVEQVAVNVTTPIVNTAPISTIKVPVAGTSQTIEVSLVQEPSVKIAGVVSVLLPKETATAGSGFTFPLPTQVFESASPAQANNARVTLQGGGSLPSWLRYDSAQKTFVAAAVPDGAFPIQVLVTVGTQTTTVIISERGE